MQQDLCNVPRRGEKWERTTPSRSCHATTDAPIATTVDEYVYDVNDGSDEQHAKNNKKCQSDNSDIDDNESK